MKDPLAVSPNDLEKIVDTHIQALMEHFDCVQILASHQQPDGTGSIFKGAGNWYARQGMAHQFIKSDDAETLVNKMPKSPPDEGEEWKKE